MVNATIPGTYVEIKAGQRDTAAVSGVVAMPLALSWGDRVIELASGENPLLKLGYKINDAKIKLIREVMNYANGLILYRLNEGEKAQGTVGGATVTAAYGGAHGNDISVTVKAVTGGYQVKTFLGTTEVDSQVIASVAGFKANGFVEITGSSIAAGTAKLAGGSDGTVEDTAYDEWLEELEQWEYNVIAYTGTDSATMTKIRQYVDAKNEAGCPIQAVMCGSGFDDPYIINNTVGGKTTGYELTAAEACATMAGIQAACGISQSATYYYPVTGWTDVSPRLTEAAQELRTQAGEILFVYKHGRVMVLYDINSMTTYTDERPEDFGKNLVIRTLGQYSRDLQQLLDTRAVGKIRNSVDGRNQIKGMIYEMTTREYSDKGYVIDFTADDIVVEPGAKRDEVVAGVNLRVADTTDKIYVTVTAL